MLRQPVDELEILRVSANDIFETEHIWRSSLHPAIHEVVTFAAHLLGKMSSCWAAREASGGGGQGEGDTMSETVAEGAGARTEEEDEQEEEKEVEDARQ